MRYFIGNIVDMDSAITAVSTRQKRRGRPTSSFGKSTKGWESCVWTEDPAGEELLEKILTDRNVDFRISDKPVLNDIAKWLGLA